MSLGLVYVGKIACLENVENADKIDSATVVCGVGGKWRGVVRKGDFKEGDTCVVFLPDSLLPQTSEFSFMEKHKWRVRMCRFRGAPSEVLITMCPDPLLMPNVSEIGTDITDFYGVTKYHKPIPVQLEGKVKGPFPGFIPKTDEPNYQSVPELVELLLDKPAYVTQKMDGSSTTAFKYKGKFGVCSRNWELEKDENNGYWKIAIKYELEENLPDGYAIQWETCGPNIQGNPAGLKSIEGFAFSVYDIENKKYLEHSEYYDFCCMLNFPMVEVLGYYTRYFEGLKNWDEETYENGHPTEGVVVRSTINELGHKPISFKIINLNYEK